MENEKETLEEFDRAFDKIIEQLGQLFKNFTLKALEKQKADLAKELEDIVRDVLNEEMYNYCQTDDLGEKDKIFEKAIDDILEVLNKK